MLTKRITNIGRAPRGVSVIEVVMAMCLIAVALMALLSAIVSSELLVEANRQESLVMNAARDLLARIEADAKINFSSLINKWNDSALPGWRGWSNKAVPISDTSKYQWPEALKGLALGTLSTTMTVNFPLDSDTLPINSDPLNHPNLTETITDINLGMPRDLNLNGTSADYNVSASYKLLPIKIVIRWDTIQGMIDPATLRPYRQMEYNAILTNYN